MPSRCWMSPRTRSVAVAVRARQTAPDTARAPVGVADIRAGSRVPTRRCSALRRSRGSVTRAIEQHQGFRAEQGFRRGVKQLDLPRPHLLGCRQVIGILHGAVEKGCRHARLAQLHHLILHQRDQRRDHDGEPIDEQRRQLVAERFAAAGRHHDQGIAAGEQVRDDLGLERTEGVVAEDRFQDVAGVIQGSARRGQHRNERQ